MDVIEISRLEKRTNFSLLLRGCLNIMNSHINAVHTVFVEIIRK